MPNPNRLNPNYILRGFDGELYDGAGNFLADVPRFQVQVNVRNADYEAAGEPLMLAVFTGYSVTLTLEQTVIRDTPYVGGSISTIEELKQGNAPEYTFQGKLQGRTARQGRGVYTFRSCVPDGAQDLINVQQGQVLSRAMAFRCNEPPDMQELLQDPR